MSKNLIKPRLILVIQYLVSIVCIYACLFVGNFVQSWLDVPIPGSIFGMLLLFLLLVFRLIPAPWIKPGANLFIRYMILLFVPISVGLMQHFELLMNNAMSIIASALGASFIVLVSLSWSLQKVLGENKR